MRLFANLADYRPPDGGAGGTALDLPDGATVDDALRRLAIPADLPRLLLVNGRDVAADHALRAGDVLSIIPPLAGG